MDNQLHTLSKLFTERLFRIPDYQRGYAWTEKQLKDFWSDIEQLEPGRNHYTGVLTLENVHVDTYSQWHDDFWIISARGYQPFYIVDGQQRMTTAIILVQIILESVPDGVKLNYTEKDDIRKKFIFDSKDNLISRSYIFGYEDNNPSYEYLKARIFCERTSGDIQETVYTQNLKRAKKFFSDKIVSMSVPDIEVLFRKLTQNLLFNIFTISEEVDVCVAFETMNNRGKPLSYLELLKNRLIYLSLKFDEPEHERAKLRRAINDCWRTIYHNLGRNKNQPLSDDWFLLTHFLTYFGKLSHKLSGGDDRFFFRNFIVPENASILLEKLFITKNLARDTMGDFQVTLKSVYDYVSSLQDSIKIWYNINNPFESDYEHDVKVWLDKIDRIGEDVYFPLVLAFLEKVKDDSKIVTFLQAVERHGFLLTVSGNYRSYYSSSFENSFLAMAAELGSGHTSPDKVVKFVVEQTNEFVKHEYFSKNAIECFRGRGFYEWRGIKYFLYEYNLHLQRRSKTDRAKIFWPEFVESRKDFMSVEHVYPQNARHEYWTSRFSRYNQKQKAALRNSLGNLLPLSKPKNSSLSNRPFDDKVEGKGDSVIGYRYGSYAENEVSKVDEWTATEIAVRGIKMLNFMEKRWSVDFGTDDQKLYILGLDFLRDDFVDGV